MNNKKRIFSIIMTFVIIATIFLSQNFIIENLHHDCKGETCPICMQLEVSVQLLSILKSAVPIISYIVLFLCVFTLSIAKSKESYSTKKTLITLKVELLD